METLEVGVRSIQDDEIFSVMVNEYLLKWRKFVYVYVEHGDVNICEADAMNIADLMNVSGEDNVGGVGSKGGDEVIYANFRKIYRVKELVFWIATKSRTGEEFKAILSKMIESCQARYDQLMNGNPQ